MSSYSEYFRQRLDAQKNRMRELNIPQIETMIGKKRKYEEAMGYNNDYIVVQESETIHMNRGSNWIDAYLENQSNLTK